jgi:hypothetical protein
VVLKEKPDTKVSIAKLGGEGGRYWPSNPRRMLTVIDPGRWVATVHIAANNVWLPRMNTA